MSNSQTHSCLYPGARFEGTQKSGRNCYDVGVTIVSVDLTPSSPTLSGHLTIHNLTVELPEITTYFDAEIIGSQYSFLTQKWGATEQVDMVHWSRFPAFREVKSELEKPGFTIPDRDRDFLFMRWKECYAVPEDGEQDINGTSFAGFYYVCLELNPAPTSTSEDTVALNQPEATVNRRPPRPAQLTGFYFHQNSEPYQQLTLEHIPEQKSDADRS